MWLVKKNYIFLKEQSFFPQESESCITVSNALSVFQNACSEIILMFIFHVFFYASCYGVSIQMYSPVSWMAKHIFLILF